MYHRLLGHSSQIVICIDYAELGASIAATLPASGIFSVRFVNPNLSLPHTCVFFMPFLPSPNSSFHLRNSARLPSASEDEGVISFNALVKLCRCSVRAWDSGMFKFAVGSASMLAGVVNKMDGTSGADEVLEEVYCQGNLTFSLTASKAAETHKSTRGDCLSVFTAQKNQWMRLTLKVRS